MPEALPERHTIRRERDFMNIMMWILSMSCYKIFYDDDDDVVVVVMRSVVSGIDFFLCQMSQD